MIQIWVLRLASALEKIGTTIFSTDTPPDWPLIGKKEKKPKKKLSTSTQQTPNTSGELFNPNQPEENPSNYPDNLFISREIIYWLCKAAKDQCICWQI